MILVHLVLRELLEMWVQSETLVLQDNPDQQDLLELLGSLVQQVRKAQPVRTDSKVHQDLMVILVLEETLDFLGHRDLQEIRARLVHQEI